MKEGTAAFDHDADYVDLTGGEGEPVLGGIDDDVPVRPKKRKRPRLSDSDEEVSLQPPAKKGKPRGVDEAPLSNEEQRDLLNDSIENLDSVIS